MTSPYTLLKAWNLRASKGLGQNFLKHPTAALHIVTDADIGAKDTVLEIGAGLGQLTFPIAQSAGQVIAVEKDRRLVPLLNSELLLRNFTHVRIVEKDILSVSLEHIVETAPHPMIVMGNLPYNISSQVVVKLIKERRLVRRAVLMFQKELAERLCAGPGSRTYGRLSVLLQYCAEVKMTRFIGADQFFPKPKVDSAVLRIDFREAVDPPADDENMLERVVQAAFGRRRKTMRNALAGALLSLDTQKAAEVLEDVEIDPRRRAETLSVGEFVALANRISAIREP
jgi:16S rRNA (adenine1518-N6/adenine1519-N6)-dimethyltransferase